MKSNKSKLNKMHSQEQFIASKRNNGFFKLNASNLVFIIITVKFHLNFALIQINKFFFNKILFIKKIL